MQKIIKYLGVAFASVVILAGCDNDKKRVEDHDKEPDVPLYELVGTWLTTGCHYAEEQNVSARGRITMWEAGKTSRMLLELLVAPGKTCNDDMFPVESHKGAILDIALLSATACVDDSGNLPSYDVSFISKAIDGGIFDKNGYEYRAEVEFLTPNTFKVTNLETNLPQEDIDETLVQILTLTNFKRVGASQCSND